jgi:hypothetical protein
MFRVLYDVFGVKYFTKTYTHVYYVGAYGVEITDSGIQFISTMSLI